MPRQGRAVTLGWNRDAMRVLSLVAPQDITAARIWWEQYAPVAYRALMDSKLLEQAGDLNDEEELAQFLNEVLLDSDSQRNWLAAGLLLFSIGGYYWMLTGARVAWSLIRSAFNSTIGNGAPEMQELCNQLRDGTISLENWQNQMANIIKVTQLVGAMTAAGGHQGLTPQILALAEERTLVQLEFLQNFADKIAAGMPLDGNICRIMRMYINAARGTFFAIEALLLANGGFTEYRNILGPTEDHCTGGGSCLEATEQGWQPVGSLPEIGNRICMSNCLCSWQYRNPLTGQVR